MAVGKFDNGLALPRAHTVKLVPFPRIFSRILGVYLLIQLLPCIVIPRERETEKERLVKLTHLIQLTDLKCWTRAIMINSEPE